VATLKIDFIKSRRFSEFLTEGSDYRRTENQVPQKRKKPQCCKRITLRLIKPGQPVLIPILPKKNDNQIKDLPY
jgi:hypothetical protein